MRHPFLRYLVSTEAFSLILNWLKCLQVTRRAIYLSGYLSVQYQKVFVTGEWWVVNLSLLSEWSWSSSLCLQALVSSGISLGGRARIRSYWYPSKYLLSHFMVGLTLYYDVKHVEIPMMIIIRMKIVESDCPCWY